MEGEPSIILYLISRIGRAIIVTMWRVWVVLLISKGVGNVISIFVIKINVGFTLQALEMWLLATMTHSMPCSTSTGMALSVNTISAGKKPAKKNVGELHSFSQ